ncbi:MAG: PAS domain-containing protein [Oscillospiraceae bacterium]|nr:PAS domain-containing protein [Oscillospiraceae bacterium]
MRRILFRKLLLAEGITLGACLLLYPLLLPTENYFRLVLQLFPVAIIAGLLLLIPMYLISEKISRGVTAELKTLKIDSKQTLSDYPELRPVARQITGIRMQMESQKAELEGQQEQLRVLTDNMQEGLLLVSATGRVLSHNHAALQLLDKEKIKGDFDVFTLSDSRIFLDLVHNALEGIRGSAVITVNDTACQLFANPVTRGSMMTGAVLVLLDVTEREKRDALRREFTSNVSHELKTPLTSIYGIADMMESGMVRSEDISGFARRIRDESARMIALIEDIIRLSRLDDDSFAEEILPLDLYEIAENVRSQLMPQAEKRSIEVLLEGEAAPMQGVPVIVEEMLYNLCDNAIKYNNDGGTVSMKVTCSEQSAIFTVTDNGIGIPQADKERIFERFYRVDKSHSKQIGGTGLGLSIVKHGAAFHNAKIELESRLGSGTTITLFFPRSTESAALAERDARRNPLDVEVPGTESEGSLIHVHDTEPQKAAEPEFDFDEMLIDEAIRETAPAEQPEEPDLTPESEPEPAPRAKTVLEANTEEIAAELEQELAVFETEEPASAEPDEEIRTDEPEPETAAIPAKIAFDPDIVPIDETTMDIKI